MGVILMTEYKQYIYKPMLAWGVEKLLPDKDFSFTKKTDKLEKLGYVFEIKYDGMRALAYVKNGSVRLISRQGLDIGHRFPKVVAELSGLPDCVLDGEIVALDKKGNVSFDELSKVAHLENEQKIAESNVSVAFMIFDILESGDRNLVMNKYSARKIELCKYFSGEQAGKYFSLKLVTIYDDFKSAWENPDAVEGVIAKRKNAPYYQSRHPAWLKVKKWKEAIMTFSEYDLHENGIGIILKDNENRVSVASSIESEKIKALIKSDNKVSVEVRYYNITDNGKMRMPVFRRVV